jgi:hypothetical protein
MCENIVEPDRLQITKWRIRFEWWTSKASNIHSEYVIFVEFYTPTMVTRTRLNITSQRPLPDNMQYLNRQTGMPSARFETAIPTSVWLRTHALIRMATGIGRDISHKPIFRQLLEKYTDAYVTWKFRTMSKKHNWDRPEDLIREWKKRRRKRSTRKSRVQRVMLNIRLYKINNMN